MFGMLLLGVLEPKHGFPQNANTLIDIDEKRAMQIFLQLLQGFKHNK